MSVFCYARIMVGTVDAVSGFKMFSEFMSLGGRFKQILVLHHRDPLNACFEPVSCMVLDFCLARLFPPSFHDSLFSVYLHPQHIHPARPHASYA